MSRRQVCDACSVRRVRCDGQTPCAGCEASSIDCTRLRRRFKPGPKGVRKATLERVRAARQSNEAVQNPDCQSEALHEAANVDLSSIPPVVEYPYLIGIDLLRLYLDIYHHKLYPVWPIVDVASLAERLQVPAVEADTYILASSVCIATILQLQLGVGNSASAITKPQLVVDEIEDLRRSQRYRQHPTLEAASISFFLHVAYLQIGHLSASTLLLREAISVAQILGLHTPGHYVDLPPREQQDHLRKLWLLFITERAHANQYDLPCIVTIDPQVPPLDDVDQPFTLSAFILLCKMFAHFSEVSSNREHTTRSLTSAHNQLQAVPTLTGAYNALQRADLCVTRQWMRLMLWKTAMPHIKMVADSSDNLESILFPTYVVRDLVSSLSEFSMDSIEAHGPGMELKLFAFATTVTDVIMCLPNQSGLNTAVGSKECLGYLANVLAHFRGGNKSLLPILQSRLTEVGLGVPAVPRFIDVSCDDVDLYGTASPSSVSNQTLDWSNIDDNASRLQI